MEGFATVASAAARRPLDETGKLTIRRVTGRLSAIATKLTESVLPMSAFAQGGNLARYFSGLCENVFHARLGVTDPPLVDYLSDLMLRFARLDSVHRFRNLTGRGAIEVADMLAEAENRTGPARRDVHRHIGDVTLFWTGVYPESLPKLRSAQTKDFFIDYREQGKRAYYIASTIETDRDEDAPNELLERLSCTFEMCAYGLGEVRREWERRDDEPRALMLE